MKGCRRIVIVAAALLVAAAAAARAEQESSSPPQQTSSFWSWLTGSSSTSKPRSAPTGRVAATPEPAKPRSNCTLLNCITLVGIGF